MSKTVMLIPLRDNQGRRFRPADEHELRSRLLQFGGFSRLPGAVGFWQSGGVVYRDRHHQYVVALSHWTQLPDWLDVVRWACRRFRQEAIYVEVAGIPDIVPASISPVE